MLVKGQVISESGGKFGILLSSDQVNIIKDSHYYKNLCTVIDNIISDHHNDSTIVRVLPFKPMPYNGTIVYAKPDKNMRIEANAYRGLITDIYNITCSLTIYLRPYDFINKNNERIIGIGIYLLGIS